jgi:hypothetical protein
MMSRVMVGLLAAAGAIMAGLLGLTHGDWFSVLVAGGGACTGLAAYLALPASKKILNYPVVITHQTLRFRSQRVLPVQPDRCQRVCRARSLLRGLRCAAPTRRRRALDCGLER